MSVEINATNFPNAAFRQYVSSTFDTNSDGILSDSEIQSITDIRLRHGDYPSMTSVQGIEFFTNLQILRLYDYPEIDYIDLSVYPNLEEFRCDYCGFLTLDFSSNNSITTIYCQRCTEITSIVLGNKASLKTIKASYNRALNTIDVSGCVNLEVLELSYANLTSVNVSSCTNLYSLVLYHVNLSTLDITNCPVLVDCYRNVAITRFTSDDVIQKYYRRVNAERDGGFEGFGTLLITTIVDGQGPPPTQPLDLRMYLTTNENKIRTTCSGSVVDSDVINEWVDETKSVCKHMHPQGGLGKERYLCIKVRLANPKIIGALKSFDFSLPVFFEVSRPGAVIPYILPPEDNGNRHITCYLANAAWPDEMIGAITQFSMGSASCSKVVTTSLQHYTWTNHDEIIEDLSKLTIFDFHFDNIHKNSSYYNNNDLYIWVCPDFKNYQHSNGSMPGYNDGGASMEPTIATLLSERVYLPTTSTRVEVEEDYGKICGAYIGGAQAQRYTWYYIPKEYDIRNVQLYDMELTISTPKVRIGENVRLTLNHTISEYVTFTFSDGDDIIYMNGISPGRYGITVDYTCSQDWYPDRTVPIGKRTITVTASDDTGRVAVSSFELVIDNLSVTGNQCILEDETYTLSFHDRKNCNLTVQFFYNETIIKELSANTDQINYSLSRSDLNLGLITKYTYPITIKVSDEYNRVDTWDTKLLIHPQLLEQPADITVKEGEQASFSITPPPTGEGDGRFYYRWEESVDNGVSWRSLKSYASTLTFTATEAQNNNKYRCAYYLAFTNFDFYSDSATLTVIKAPVIVRNLQNVYAPENNSAELQLEIEAGVGITYQWQYKDARNLEWININESPVPMEDATITIYEIENVTSDLNGRLYRCILSNQVGSVISNEVSVNIITAPVILQQPTSISVVEGTIAVFLVEIANQPTLTHTYQWQVKAPNGDWNDVVIADEDFQEEYSIRADLALSGYQYRCIVTNELGTTTSDPATLTVTADTRQSSPSTLSLVEGTPGSISIDTKDVDESYQWQFSTDGLTWSDIRYATQSTYEFVAVLNNNDTQYRCKVKIPGTEVYSSPSTLTVTADPSFIPPVIVTHPSSLEITEGDNATFSVVASGNDLSYQWKTLKDGTWYNINGANSASYTTLASRSLNGNQYRCQVSNAAGGVYSNTATLTVTSSAGSISTPTISTQPRSANVNDGQTAIFSLTANGGGLSYQWYIKRNGQWYPISGAANAIYSVIGRSANNGTQYRCLVTNSAGSVYSNVVDLNVQSAAPLSFYGYHSIIISGKNTYGEWEMYPTSRPHVAPPEVKTSYVDVPGADGGLDYTDLLTGEPRFGYRKGSWEFLLIPQERWPDVYRSLCNFLNGRVHTVVLEDDPTWQYTGRLSVNKWESAAHNSLITIDYILDPNPVNLDDESYSTDDDDLAAAARILRKPGNEGMIIGMFNGSATVVDPATYFEDGDNISY